MSWRQVGFLVPQDLAVPFFIEWAEGSAHPAEGAPGGCSIARYTVGYRNRDRLQRLCTDLGAAVITFSAHDSWLELVLDTPRVEVKLTS